MSFMQTHGLDFEVEEYDSDLESVNSEDDFDFVVLDDWVANISTFSDFELRQYTPKGNLTRITSNALVDAIHAAHRSTRCVTAVRLLADIYDLDSEEDVRWSQNIRFETANFESSSEMRDRMLEYISGEEAPIWHRLLTDETSDKGYNKLVKYHMDYFDLCVQTSPKTRSQVTTVCGEQEIHPGMFIKMITDHGNLVYRKNDCLIQCLNEVCSERHDPDDIRREIWKDEKKMNKDIHTPRHIKHICAKYDVRLTISDVLMQKNSVFNSEGRNEMKLVKVGKTLGILDRMDISVDKRNVDTTTSFFDLETVGPDQRVYAFTWRCKNGDLTVCHNNIDYVENALIDKILDTVDRLEDDATMTSYSWNGSRFDSWIVFKLLKKKFNKKLWIHDIIVNSGNELLTFKVTLRTPDRLKPRHIVFKDAKKMFSVSMPEACKVFGINEGKHEFNHDEVDEVYMNGEFDEYIKENRGKILDYVRQDGVLLETLTKEIARLYNKEGINMHTVLTRSVASSIVWQKTIEQYKILKDVTLSPYAHICDGVRYNDIMDHAIGGRTQCVQRGVFTSVCGIDVNSMYPYVCANNEYPCGQIIELLPRYSVDACSACRTSSGVCTTNTCRVEPITPPVNKLGIYYVRIKKQSYPHVVPYRRGKHYAYNWEHKGEFEKWITNVDLEQIDDYEVIKGFYWTDKTDKFYKDFMIDNYNERISIEKSDPRNLHIKLKMNGVTGSVFQHSFREMVMIFTKEEFEENVKKYSELVTVIGCESINDRQYIVTMRPVKFKEGDLRIKAQREFCKGAITQKPWVLTMFTYSYARKVLRDEWIEIEKNTGCKVIYCDTDSLFFVNLEGIIPKDKYIHINTTCIDCAAKRPCSREKELGKWSIECWNDEGSFYTPKVYAIKDIGKLRIKGVGYNSLVTDTEYSNSDLNYEQKLKLFLECAKRGDVSEFCEAKLLSSSKEDEGITSQSLSKTGVHPSYRHVKDLIEGKPLKTINFIMEKSSQHGIQKKYEIKIIK